MNLINIGNRAARPKTAAERLKDCSQAIHRDDPNFVFNPTPLAYEIQDNQKAGGFNEPTLFGPVVRIINGVTPTIPSVGIQDLNDLEVVCKEIQKPHLRSEDQTSKNLTGLLELLAHNSYNLPGMQGILQKSKSNNINPIRIPTQRDLMPHEQALLNSLPAAKDQIKKVRIPELSVLSLAALNSVLIGLAEGNLLNHPASFPPELHYIPLASAGLTATTAIFVANRFGDGLDRMTGLNFAQQLLQPKEQSTASI